MLWNEKIEQWKYRNALEGVKAEGRVHCKDNWLDESDQWDFETVDLVLRGVKFKYLNAKLVILQLVTELKFWVVKWLLVEI